MTEQEALDRSSIGGIPGSSQGRTQGQGPVEAGGNEYVVEKILRHRVLSGKSKRREFLVQWENYPTADATWEPERNLTEKSIDDYFNTPPPRKKAKARHQASGSVASIASELYATSADAEDKARYMEQISGGLEDTPERMEHSPDVMEETAGGSDGSGDAAHADQSTDDAEPEDISQ